MLPPSQTGEEQASELVALAGSGDAFAGTVLGIGGLDDVLQQMMFIKLVVPFTDVNMTSLL